MDFNRLYGKLFIDIETVASSSQFSDLSAEIQRLWSKKSSFRFKLEEPSEDYLYTRKAAIFAEFSKVVCISIGYFEMGRHLPQFKTKSFFNVDEKTLIRSFIDFLDQFRRRETNILIGHNVAEFDIPFLCRRMLCHQITLPIEFQISNKKSWQIDHIQDTLRMWKFGDYKHYTSLELLANVLQVPSSKECLSGNQIHHTYYIEGDLSKIAKYCESDVVCVSRIYSKIKQITLPNNLNIVSLTSFEGS